MLKHYFISTLRGIRFNPFYSIISILGLSIGIASCLLIYSYWTFENSFDRFHPDSEKIVRVSQEKKLETGGINTSASTFSKVGQELKNNSSAVESVLRIHRSGQNTSLHAGEKVIIQDDIIGAEPSFFDFFKFNFIQGSSEQWKNTPQSVILTEPVANRLFGNTNPVGKSLVINGVYGSYRSTGYEEFKNYIVAGVIEDLPRNTHLDFAVLISLNLYQNPDQEFSNWGDQFYTYVKIFNSDQDEDLRSSLNALQEQVFSGQGISFKTTPLEAIHLKSNLSNEFKSNGSEQILFLLSALAILILCIAGCNYINFAIARSILRKKELELRKIFWAGKFQLFSQLIFEALFINMIAFGFAFLTLILLNPVIIEVSDINLVRQLLSNDSWYFQLGILAIAVLLSGLYPAWLVSKNSPTSRGSFKMPIQRPLIVFQFAISIFVIGFTLLISSQLDFMKKSNPGLDLEKTLVLSGPSVENEGVNLAQQISGFMNLLRSNPKITGLTSANFIPGKPIKGKAEGYVRRLGSPEESANTYSFSQIDSDFISEFDVQVLAGRGFDADRNEQQGVLINEEASRLLGFDSPKDAIGERIYYRRNSTPEIIGVAKNFHQFSLREAYQPIIFEQGDQPDLYLFLKYQAADESALLSQVETSWKSSFPGNPFNHFYLQEFYNTQYQQDQNFFTAFRLFSSLAILVASLGFFGLTYFEASSKIKEIGIRKTLGASFLDISRILANGTISLLVVAGVVSIPLIYYLGESWLENYAFKTEFSWWILIAPVLLFSILSITLVMIQSIRCYLVNPISSLQEGSNRTFQR
ncbi:ABC transporter permease [Algoriphagus yeomjeoni]|uniref:ABC transporter permease n=1 Tax=Algoriphagus yeomjeoni TaxID=291403 RepID=UPI003CE4608A